MMKENLLIVFCKNPELGKVKTRLAEAIGEDKALAIYYKLLHATREAIQSVDADKAILYDQYIDTEDQWQDEKYLKALQSGADIGERMYNALHLGKKWGYKKVGLIGSDIYGLTSVILNDGFRQLETKDIIFGPAKDGGYYFVGCHVPVKEIFTLEKWSHEQVLNQSLAIAKKLKLTVDFTPELRDIDRIGDLKETGLVKLIE